MSVSKVKGDPNDFWDEFDWEDMSEEEQELWEVLGWDEDSWDEEEDEPDSSDKYWEDLTNKEQAAASVV